MGWKHLKSTNPADKDAVGAVRHDNSHHWITGLEHVPARQGAQFRNDRSVRYPDARIDLQCAEAEIEQHRLAIAFSQRFAIRPELCQHKALRHRALQFAQAERDAMAPALARDAFRGDRPDFRERRDAYPAARGDRRQIAIGLGELKGLMWVATELGQRPKSTDAPVRFTVRELNAQEFAKIGFRQQSHRRVLSSF